MATPVFSSACSIWSTDRLPRTERSAATAPATWGAAMEVPVLDPKLPPRIEEAIFVPGASMSTTSALLEDGLTASSLVVLPTVNAVVIHPGAPTPLEKPPFPDEITVAIPSLRS